MISFTRIPVLSCTLFQDRAIAQVLTGLHSTYGGSYTSGSPEATDYVGSCDISPAEISVDASGIMTSGGSGAPLTPQKGQAAGGSSASASLSVSSSGGSGGSDGQYTPDSVPSAASTSIAGDNGAEIDEPAQGSLSQPNTELPSSANTPNRPSASNTATIPSAPDTADVGKSPQNAGSGGKKLCKSPNGSWFVQTCSWLTQY